MRAAELARLAGEGPKTPEEFERSLAGTEDKVEPWVGYMTWLAGMADVEGYR